MIKLKSIHVKNYCGYRDTTFDFTYPHGDIKQLSCFYGPNGCGKCVTGDTYIIDGTGMQTMESVFDGIDVEDDTWYDKKIDIFTGGKTENVEKIYFNGTKKTLKVTTSNGYTIAGSEDNHRILGVVNGKIDFVKLSDLKNGDFVCIQKGSHFSSKDTISLDEASLLGYLISEGYLSRKYGITFTNTDDDVIDIVYGLFIKCFPTYKPYVFSRKKGNSIIKNIYARSRSSIEYLSKITSFDLSGDKKIPDCILSGSKKAARSFLRSFFEGDGGIIKGTRSVCCSSKSGALIHQIQLLLLRLGIVSSIKKKTAKLKYTKKYPNGYVSWNLFIYGREVLKYARIIGFDSTRKKAELKNVVDITIKKTSNPNKDIIPVDVLPPLTNYLNGCISRLPPTGKRGKHFSRLDHRKNRDCFVLLQNKYTELVKKGISRYKIKKCIRHIHREMMKFSTDICCQRFDFLDSKYFFDTVETIEPCTAKLYDISVDNGHKYWSNGFISHNSNILNAIAILCNVYRYHEKDMDMFFRKLIYHPDYDPTYASFYQVNDMEISGVFDTTEGDKQVIISNDGVIKNELPVRERMSFQVYIDADNPNNLYKFQLHAEMKERFIDLAQTVYGFDCTMGSESPDLQDGSEFFFTDFTIHKQDGTRVHFKRMSAGEKKIATLVRDLCNPLYMDANDIILVDNIEMHIYKDRHARLITKILDIFPTKQFLVTTHSPILVGMKDEAMGINIPAFLRPEFLYNIEDYKEGKTGLIPA
jgi:intein/homing endonuclease